jgi:DNA-binding NtrC family response regulator
LITVSSDDSAANRKSELRGYLAPHLFVVFDAANPLGSTSRHELTSISQVTLGRADPFFERSGDRLEIGLRDNRISGRHLRIFDAEGTWWLEDLGSKNGTLLNGQMISGRSRLADGSSIELGQTFLRFRASLPVDPSAQRVAAEPTGDAVAPGLETLLPGLAGQFDDLARYAATSGPVVILGETGTGKDVTAQAYHHLTRRSGAFVPVNCGALPSDLVESLLFGHKRGAFSGAVGDAQGLLRSADGGTLFLDELGDLPLVSQTALLRVLESREVTPVGTSKPVKIDVRFVAATHRHIPSMVSRGEFRADLWARLCGHVVVLPPLRNRREDLGLLVAKLLRRLSPDRASDIRFDRDAARTLLHRDFPLNTRELASVLGRALALSKDAVLCTAVLEPRALGPDESYPESKYGAKPVPDSKASASDFLADSPLSPKERLRRAQLEILLDEHNGNVAAVARSLGKARPMVHRWIRELGVDSNRYRR